jgi:hypothetical protein
MAEVKINLTAVDGATGVVETVCYFFLSVIRNVRLKMANATAK